MRTCSCSCLDIEIFWCQPAHVGRWLDKKGSFGMDGEGWGQAAESSADVSTAGKFVADKKTGKGEDFGLVFVFPTLPILGV